MAKPVDKAFVSKSQISSESTQAASSELIQASKLYTALSQHTPQFLDPIQKTKLSVPDILAQELQVARQLNVPMTSDVRAFAASLSERITDLTQTRKNVILLLDETSGTYTSLYDMAQTHFAVAPKEVTWISDHYLQDLLGSENVLHQFLHHQGSIFGIVAIADKADGSAFNFSDEVLLEQVTQYLSVQVNHYVALQQLLLLPTTQRILLEISNRLLCSVDAPQIFEAALDSVLSEMPFTAGQYVQLDPKTNMGSVLFQHAEARFSEGEPLFEVDQFASLLSLFQSQVTQHPYLYLKGASLGDKSFSELFGLPDIVSVVLLPVFSDEQVIQGALVLFQQKTAIPLSKDALAVLEQVALLVMSACGRAQILEKALEIASTDELTGAVNRRGFYHRCDAEVDRARRHTTPLCMALIDVDHFKMINDSYGHLAGDQVLSQLAKAIQKNIRKSDLLCRFGGEEFALLLPETSLQAGFELLERLRRKIEKMNLQTPQGTLKITFSGGIAQVDTQQNLTKDSMQVISDALALSDEALYEAKQFGRNRVVAFEGSALD